jgi:hypothetical protein
MQLRQPIHDALGQGGRRRIPALPVRVAADAKRAGEVDDADAALQQRRPDFSRRRFRQRQEDDIRVGGEAIDVERRHRAVPDPRECRQRPRRARRARRHRGGQRHRRMAREQPDELLPGIAGRAGDGDARAGAAGGVGTLGGERGCYGHLRGVVGKRIFIQSYV